MQLNQLLSPSYSNMLSAMSAWLDKAEAQMGKEEAQALLTARLAADMFPLATQVRFSCVQAIEGMCRLTGKPLPAMVQTLLDEGREAGTAPGSLDDARNRIAETLEWVRDVEPIAGEPEGRSDLPHELPNGMIFDFTADEYTRDWAIPQFYFHVMTAYAILRAQGVDLGKADYVAHLLGKIRPASAPQG